MAITIDVNFFNSFALKRVYATVSGGEMPYADNQGTRATSWTTPIVSNSTYDWYIEESRIRGGYNNTSMDIGVKAYIVEENDSQQRRSNSLIYSGIYNSRTGINNTNQFSVAEEITKSVDPVGGSIQKLYAEDTNLTVFQERKCNVALIDKDAIYSAEGGGTVTTANQVIGSITPIPGNWGIATNPESFATYGYTKYFVDKERNAVLKMEGTSIQEISSGGMTDFFRDQLSAIGSNGDILGSYDVYNKNYVISLLPNGRYSAANASTDLYKTLTWDELNAGWVSFYTYQPDIMFSVRGDFYSASPSYAANGNINTNSYLWKHYSNTDRNSFYGFKTPSSVQFVFNPEPNFIKTFKTVNYEGSNGWEISDFRSDNTGQNASVTPTGNWLSNFDQATGNVRLANGSLGPASYNKIYSYDEGLYTEDNIEYRAGFYRKQNKYYAVVPNNTQTPMYGEVIFGNQTMGIKGYFATVTMKTDNTTNNGGPKSLFAVSSEFIQK
tara:strand:- start:11527 stop:13017 length:1491 start_codon:yes stop_codon:yes gene_type:complete